MNTLHKKKPRFSARHCTACWACIDTCPHKAIGKITLLWHRHAVIRYAACIGCMKCVQTCPNGCFRSDL